MIRLAERALFEGDPGGVRKLLQRIPANDARHAEVLRLIALSVTRDPEPGQAISLLQEALALKPETRLWWRDLAFLQFAHGLWKDSIESFRASDGAAYLSSRDLRVWARALRSAGEYGECIEVLERLLSAEPSSNEVRRELAELYGRCGFFHEELRHRRNLCADAEGLRQLARAQFQTGDTVSAMASATLAMAQQVDREFHSQYLCFLLHDRHQDAALIRRAHEEWAGTHIEQVPSLCAWTNVVASERRLRIGYVCGEGAGVPSYYFLTSLLDFRNRERFHVTWYHASADSGGRTKDFAAKADCWRDISGSLDEHAVEQIRRDQIDVLVDVSGHYEGNRLGIFGRRAAPVQVSFPNYPCTTGVREIGYIFTDEWSCPAGTEAQYTEKALKIPSGYLSYSMPAAPLLSESPVDANGVITFGIFQRPAKFTTEFWDAVASILRECRGSSLLIHYASRELDEPDSRAQRAVCAQLEKRGVDQERIRFTGRVGAFDHLEVIARTDIALDTFPYNGQTTTCECLLMGVPVISISGGYHAARMGLAILDRVGCGDLCANSIQDYVELAVQLAKDRRRLTCFRRELRTRLTDSSLVGGSSVREIEEKYLEIWRHWCDRIH